MFELGVWFCTYCAFVCGRLVHLCTYMNQLTYLFSALAYFLNVKLHLSVCMLIISVVAHLPVLTCAIISSSVSGLVCNVLTFVLLFFFLKC